MPAYTLSVTMPSATSMPSRWPRPSGPARLSRAEVVEAAIARTEAVNAELNGLAYRGFRPARGQASRNESGWPGFFARRADLHQGQRRRRRAADDARHRRVGAASGARRQRNHPGGAGHRADLRWARRSCRSSGSAPPPSMLGWGRSATRGTPTTRRAPRRRGRGRSSPPVWCRSRTPTTAAVRSAFRPPATGWSGSSRHAVGCRWTRSCAGCRWASSPTGC